MKRKLLSILLACILALGITMPVLAGDPPDKLKIGDKVVLKTGHEVTYLGKGEGGRGEMWQADFGDLKYIPGTETLIECRWDYDTGKKEWVTRPNLFTASVKETKVTIENESKKLSWQPDVFLGSKKLTSDKNPTLLLYDPINSNYIGNTLQWEYSNSITRSLRIIEGMLIEYYTITELPTDDILIMPHTVKDLEFIWTRPSVAWDADNKLVPLTIGKNGELTLLASDIAEATLPITIDPDTTFTTSASDGLVTRGEFEANAAASWSAAYGASSGDVVNATNEQNQMMVETAIWSSDYFTDIWRAFVYFDTSALPDDVTITAAVLRLYGSDTPDTDFGAWTLQVQIGSGTPPTYPHDPLVLADYNQTLYSGDGGTLASGSMGLGYKELTLNATGRGWVSKTGATKFALRELEHDINNSAPSYSADFLANRWSWYSYEQGDGYRPELVVTYAAIAPAITTDAATYVAQNSARLNSTVDDDGYEACDVRFGYGDETQTVANFELYDTKTAWVNDTYTTGQHPYKDITGLVANTGYFYRAQIRNDHSTVTSTTEIQFTTEAAIVTPTNLKAYPGSTTVGLTWTKGASATETMIRYSEVTYPTDETEGTHAYTGTLASYTITGLTIGHTYYIVAIGVTDAEYTAPVEVMATTGAVTEAAAEPGAPTTPAGLFLDPDPTQISNFPGYAMFNSVAADLNIPLDTVWMYIILGGIGFIGFLFYTISHNVMVVMVIIAIGIAWGSLIGILPLWMMFLVIILGLGLFQFQVRRT